MNSKLKLQHCLQKISQEELEEEATFALTLSDKTRNMLSLGNLISAKLPPPSSNPQAVLSMWQTQKETKDVCPVCGVRPQGYDGAGKPLNQKALNRNVCGICERRRVNRSSDWAGNLKTTVWTDEVADENGRLALIVGRFGLEHWLTGEALSSIMAFEPSTRTLKDPKRNNNCYDFEYNQFINEIHQALQSNQQPNKQTPLLNNLLLSYQRVGDSFADTYDFYVGDSDLSRDQREAHLFALSLMRQQPSPARLRRIWETIRRFWQTVLEEKDEQGKPILAYAGRRLEIIPINRDDLNLGKFHSYELAVNHARISVVWDSDNRRFVVCENLAYFARPEQLGRPLQSYLQPGNSFTLEEPAGYGARNKKWGEITIERVNELPDDYLPVIPILAEPRTFMAIVPANRAMSVVKAIKTKYEREMGKVRNRLPLTLGVVYFGRRAPLAAAIETGRRMLARPAQSETWEVIHCTKENPISNKWPSSVCLTLKRGETQICLSIPTGMGDSQTPDLWHPYWRVDSKPTNRTRYFIGPDDKHWVHVTELRAGDRVEFMPSTFDYEYLDTTARRFEVIYDQHGQRRISEKRSRPYPLEDLETVEDVWQQLSQNLSTSQIKSIESLIEGKRHEWKQPRSVQKVDETFRQFVRDVLKEAQIWSEVVEQAALRGLMSDAIEIHMTLHKEKTAKDQA